MRKWQSVVLATTSSIAWLMQHTNSISARRMMIVISLQVILGSNVVHATHSFRFLVLHSLLRSKIILNSWWRLPSVASVSLWLVSLSQVWWQKSNSPMYCFGLYGLFSNMPRRLRWRNVMRCMVNLLPTSWSLSKLISITISNLEKTDSYILRARRKPLLGWTLLLMVVLLFLVLVISLSSTLCGIMLCASLLRCQNFLATMHR